MVTVTLVAVIVVALFFDFTNGFHDTANSIATSVSTHALSPRNAVAMAAFRSCLRTGHLRDPGASTGPAGAQSTPRPGRECDAPRTLAAP
mgnify:CR=1 FL=1